MAARRPHFRAGMQPHRSERVGFALDDHEGIAAHRAHRERRAFLLAEGAPPPLAGPPPVRAQGVQADRSNRCAAAVPAAHTRPAIALRAASPPFLGVGGVRGTLAGKRAGVTARAGNTARSNSPNRFARSPLDCPSMQPRQPTAARPPESRT